MTTRTTNVTYISIIDGTASIQDGAGNGDACNLDATLTTYVAELSDALALVYPGVQVHYRWENSNRQLGIETLDGDYDQYDEIVANVQRVAEDIYERGTFWVAA